MGKFTPGPWELVDKVAFNESHGGYFIRAPKKNGLGKWALAEVKRANDGDKCGEANARLMVAAPEMAELLALIVTLDGDAHPGLSTWHAARAKADQDARALLARINK